MTTQEAIEIFKERLALAEKYSYEVELDGYDEAMRMAIEALSCSEKPNNSDLINRQAAIKKFEPWLKVEGYSEGELNMLKAILYELTVMPSAQPERKKGKCIWCDSPYRIEYYWIDNDGYTASFQDEERHLVATGIANYCPNCGRLMER